MILCEDNVRALDGIDQRRQQEIEMPKRQCQNSSANRPAVAETCSNFGRLCSVGWLGARFHNSSCRLRNCLTPSELYSMRHPLLAISLSCLWLHMLSMWHQQLHLFANALKVRSVQAINVEQLLQDIAYLIPLPT